MIWADYIVLANDLVRQESEVSKRSAVSRAYYGAFNLARRWLEARGIAIEHRRAHRQVWHAFSIANHATPATREKWEAIGDLGGALRVLRNRADYADEVPGLDGQALGAVESAERISSLLGELEIVD